MPVTEPFNLHRNSHVNERRDDSFDSDLLKLDAVKFHYEVQAYVGETTSMPWVSQMWATLHEDGKFMLHSGGDPLNHGAAFEDLRNKESVTLSESLWQLAGIVRDNNSKDIQLEAFFDFQDVFAGLGIRLVRENEIQIDLHEFERERELPGYNRQVRT